MKIKLWPLALIFYVNKIKSDSTGVTHGIANAFVVRIVNSHAQDKGLLVHELTHVKRFWLHGLLVELVLYRFFPRYRLSAEAEAYARQWLVSDYDQNLMGKYINAIDKCYGLNYPIPMIQQAFEKWVQRINHGYMGNR